MVRHRLSPTSRSGTGTRVRGIERLLDAVNSQDPVRAKAAWSAANSIPEHLAWLYEIEPLLEELVASGACDVVDGPPSIGFDAGGRFSHGWPG